MGTTEQFEMVAVFGWVCILWEELFSVPQNKGQP